MLCSYSRQACLTKPMRKSELIDVLLTFACGRPSLPVPAVQLAGSLNLPVELTMVTPVSSLRILLVENSLVLANSLILTHGIFISYIVLLLFVTNLTMFLFSSPRIVFMWICSSLWVILL